MVSFAAQAAPAAMLSRAALPRSPPSQAFCAARRRVDAALHQAARAAAELGAKTYRGLPLPSVYEPTYPDTRDATLRLRRRPQHRSSLTVTLRAKQGRLPACSKDPVRLQIPADGEIVLPSHRRGGMVGKPLDFVIGTREPAVLSCALQAPKFGHLWLAERLSGRPWPKDLKSTSVAVRYAGTLVFDRAGRLVYWDNDSGHYTPHPGLARQAGLPMRLFIAMHVRKLVRYAQRKNGLTATSMLGPTSCAAL